MVNSLVAPLLRQCGPMLDSRSQCVGGIRVVGRRPGNEHGWVLVEYKEGGPLKYTG